MVKSALHAFRLAMVTCLLLMLTDSSIHSQEKAIELSGEISKAEERRLKKQVNVFVDLVHNEKWGKVYDMLWVDPVDGPTRVEFIKKRREDAANSVLTLRTLRFDVKRFFVIVDARFHERVAISGCMTIRERGVIRRYRGTINAERNGSKQWLFTSFPFVNPTRAFGGGPIACD
jgi:hypothetical protein